MAKTYILVNPNLTNGAGDLSPMAMARRNNTQYLTTNLSEARVFDHPKTTEDYLAESTRIQRNMEGNAVAILGLRDLEGLLVAELKTTFEVLTHY